MADEFKAPFLPKEEQNVEESLPTSSTTDHTVEVSHAPFLKPELPPANFTPRTRHKNLPYTLPESSTTPPIEYTLEVLRNGSIIDHIALSRRSYTVFGRVPDSDIVLEHPTISRYHALIQYKSEFEHGQSAGLFIYDCGSTHGTFVNKKRIEPKVYVRIKIGHIIKFGQSTRLYILQGDTTAEAEYVGNTADDEVTHEQMKAFHAKRAKALAAVRAKRENAATEGNDDVEMDWGMGPDVDEATANAAATIISQETAQNTESVPNSEEKKRQAAADDLKNRIDYQQAKNDKAVLKEIMSRVDEPISDADGETNKEPFYMKDPKRALTAFFEREGAELTYDVEDHQFGSYRCTIKLPIVDEYGRAVQAECEQKHCKRKEIIHECILAACKILDDHGVLREGTAASSLNTSRVKQIKRQMLEENDFYEEDEDTFFDRTGELEKKRLKRMEWSGHLNQERKAETFDSLCEKLTNIYKEEVSLEHQLEEAKQLEENAAKNAPNLEKTVDELDLYIRQLKQGERVNLKMKSQWRKRLLQLENEEKQYVKLLKICKPKEFDISSWRKKIQEETKQNLTTKSLHSPVQPFVQPVKPVIQAEQSSSVTSAATETEHIKPEVQENVFVSPAPPSSNKSVPRVHQKSTKSSRSSKDQYDDSDHYSTDKFAEWMPPEDEQTGDGRTALNEKYGY